MKIETRTVDKFLKSPDKGIRAIPLFGPDDGPVRERGAAHTRTVVEDLGDPFRSVSRSSTAIGGVPAALVRKAVSATAWRP
ncbi:MAG: hypothetical protein FJX57_07045 [Alphaproteobacteria bacterium]|nr:hypothetical protein [Alphaproteobacteria bacterium]